MTRITLIVSLAIGSLFASAAAFGQTAQAPLSGPPELKTIGVPSSAKSQIVPSLIVMNPRGATLQGDKLTLTGVSPNSIVFADRPCAQPGTRLPQTCSMNGNPATALARIRRMQRCRRSARMPQRTAMRWLF